MGSSRVRPRAATNVSCMSEQFAFQDVVESAPLGWADWVTAASVLAAGIVISIVARRVVVGLLRRGATAESMAERLIGRVAQVTIILVALSYALSVLDVRIGPLLGALGIGGIAVALALQQTLKDLFAGAILHAQRPLRVGEEIVSGDMQGTVLNITSRAVTVRSNSGRTLFIPNALLLDREIVNLVRFGSRRSTAVVGVAYGTDLPRALEVIQVAASSGTGVLVDPPVRVLLAEFADSSVNFEVDFWHSSSETVRRETNSNVLLAIYQALDEAAIVIPFPQRTLWNGDQLDLTQTEPPAA